MLRNVAIYNFIHFRERQYLSFEVGSNVIIGGNCTGKSSIFELIRRCLSLKQSTSLSTIPNADQPAYVLCKFDLPEQFWQAPELKDSVNKCTPANVLYSGIFFTNPNEGARAMYKIVCLPSKESRDDDVWVLKNENCQQLLDNCTAKPCQLLTDTNARKNISDYVKTIIDDECTRESAEETSKLLIQELNSVPETPRVETLCEKVLENLTETFVFTFPLRSIGPLQWNKSEKINMKKKDKNYEKAAKKAEILNTLVGSDDVDPELEKKYFSILTHPLQYTFKKKKDTGLVECNSSKYALLKTPEGILEAKQFALILAHKKYLTVCFEEPDHGMHPHMIEKMRNLVLRTYKDKVVIFTSHHPSMLGKWTLERTHVCRRNGGQGAQVSHNIIKVDSKINILLQDEMRNFLFANTVLFVEGRDDHLVLSLLFDEVLRLTPGDDERPKDITPEYLTDLQHLISGIQILTSRGHTIYSNYSDLAKRLKVPCMFLFDCDVPYKQEKSQEERNLYRNQLMLICNENDIGKRNELIKKTTLEHSDLKNLEQLISTQENTLESMQTQLEGNVYQQRKIIHKRVKEIFGFDFNADVKTEEVISRFENENVFFWKSGDLEDVICESILQSKIAADDKKALLFDLFLLQGGKITVKRKKSTKSHLPFMDATKANKLSCCLLENKEIRRLFEFLRKVVNSQSQ